MEQSEYVKPVKKVYIVGVSKQETGRRSFEDEFGQKLKEYGIATVFSYKDLKNNQEADLDLITEKVKANGADTLLLTRILGRRTEEVVNPGRVSGYSSAPLLLWQRELSPGALLSQLPQLL